MAPVLSIPCTLSQMKLFIERSAALFLFFALVSIKGYCQQFYVNTSDAQLYLITVTANGPVYQLVPGCGTYNYFSIAISGNKIYYNTPSGSLYSGDISPGNTPNISNCTLISSSAPGNALTVDKQGLVYYVTYNQLYLIDPANPTPVLLGSMPYSSAGDVAFYNNELYMAAPEGIVDVNLSDPSKSTLYISIPGAAIYGLTTFTLNGVKTMYALTGNGGGTDLLELDMQNKSVKGVVGNLPFVVYDAGSVDEAGTVPSIGVDSISIKEECNVYNKADVSVFLTPDANKNTYTFTLNTGQTNATGIFNGLDPGNYQVNIKSSGTAIPKNASFTVTDYSATGPVINATLKDPICGIKGQIKLDAGADNSLYTIQYGTATFAFDHVFAGLDPGSYHFTILNDKGCIAAEKDYALLQQVCPPIVVDSIQVTPECYAYGKASVSVFTRPHPDNYTYTLGTVSDTTGIFNLVAPGAYSLLITSSGGNTMTQQVVVPDYTLNNPNISYNLKNAVCALPGEVKFTLNGNTNGAASIMHGTEVFAVNETVTGLTSGNNHFSILNKQGCIIDTLDINVPHDGCNPIIFPNSFTPNGDNINDVFKPLLDSDPLVYDLSVFDRWGKLLFQSKSFYTGWDGKYGGRPVAFGVYYWVATYTMPYGEKTKQSGYVTLIK